MLTENFIYELELGKRKLTIYALHKVYKFLGHIPEILKINESTLEGKLFTCRITNGLTYSKLAKEVGLDKSTLIRVGKGLVIKPETKAKIENYLIFKY